MYRNLSKLFIATNLLLLSACTQPGEKTAVGAATGGAIGAGLGAIVGSQTGNAGAGLVIGAAAGAGAGAAVGNSLEAQEQNLKTQDEAIERQEQRIRAQQSELTELRRMGGDSAARSPFDNNSAAELQARRSGASYTRSAPSNFGAVNPSSASAGSAMIERPIAAELPKANQVTAVMPENSIPQGFSDNDLSPSEMQPLSDTAPLAANSPGEVRGALNWEQPAAQGVVASAASENSAQPSECRSAQEEMNQASHANEAADKLFHIRRALRLCPDNAPYHTALADLYRSLNRSDDAAFEYQEALKLEPSNSAAKKGLEVLGK